MKLSRLSHSNINFVKIHFLNPFNIFTVRKQELCLITFKQNKNEYKIQYG